MQCETCHRELLVGSWPFCPHGLGVSVVIGDEMDHVQVNGLKHPRRFTSKQEHKRWLKEHGYRIYDTHEGDQGSDKNKFTTRLATMDPQTLKNAQELVTRAASAPATRSADDAPIGITSDDGVIRYLTDRRRAEQGKYF